MNEDGSGRRDLDVEGVSVVDGEVPHVAAGRDDDGGGDGGLDP